MKRASPVDRRRRTTSNHESGACLARSAQPSWSLTDGTPSRSSDGCTDGSPNLPSRSLASRKWERMSTPEALELIASAASTSDERFVVRQGVSYHRGGGHGLVVDPYDGDDGDNDLSDSDASMSSEDLDENSPTSTEEELLLMEEERDEDDVDDNVDNDNDSKASKRRRRRSFRILRLIKGRSSKNNNLDSAGKEIDVNQYMARRVMTKQQEHWNAYTMIPAPAYCIYFLLAGLWVNQELVEQAKMDLSAGSGEEDVQPLLLQQQVDEFSKDECFNQHHPDHNSSSGADWMYYFLSNYTKMPSMPPAPVIAVAAAICVHAPFSFLYHYKYAHALPPGVARTIHWSRRCDQAMIHVASALMSYATSGSYDFFLANVLYNVDCIYRLFLPKVRPRRNKIRIGISCLAYTIPILRRGDWFLFLQVWLILGFGGWLFGAYPIGGWSHSAFHLVLAFLPPCLMMAACDLPASQQKVSLAAFCIATAK